MKVLAPWWVFFGFFFHALKIWRKDWALFVAWGVSLCGSFCAVSLEWCSEGPVTMKQPQLLLEAIRSCLLFLTQMSRSCYLPALLAAGQQLSFLRSKQVVRSFRQEEEWKSWTFWMVKVFQSQRSLGSCMKLPKNCCKSNFHHCPRHWQVWNAPRSTLRLLHLLILAVSLGRKHHHLGFEGNRVGAAGCILKMVPCSIFTSSLFPARVHRKQVYSHLSFSAVFSEATRRNMILPLQLLNISPGNLSFTVSFCGGWSCFSSLSVCEQQHLQREGRAFSGKG